jgi:hypothetical protein
MRAKMDPRTPREIAEDFTGVEDIASLDDLDAIYGSLDDQDSWEDDFGNQNETLDGMD